MLYMCIMQWICQWICNQYANENMQDCSSNSQRTRRPFSVAAARRLGSDTANILE